jgi:hypothetical protein
MLGYQLTNAGGFEISLLRSTTNHLGASVGKYLVVKALLTAAESAKDWCTVHDSNVDELIQDALIREGFSLQTEKWCRFVLIDDLSSSELLGKLREVAAKRRIDEASLANKILEEIEAGVATGDPSSLASVERVIWPALLTDLDTPAFMIPIKPVWAQHLFDEGIANEELFGARTDLALNHEAVYYRAAKNSGGLRSRSRLIWYVSKDKKKVQSGEVRATSLLDEVVVDSVKELFQRFRRLGIYEWNDIKRITRGDHTKPAMALRFSRTSALRKPIPWSKLRELMHSHGVRSTLQSPVSIPSDMFFAIRAWKG